MVVIPAQQHCVGHLGCMPSVIAAFLDAGSADRIDVACARTSQVEPFRLK